MKRLVPCLLLICTLCSLREPLFSSNQHTYFLHGLVKTPSYAELRVDWLARTVDLCPVFSSLVTVSARSLPWEAFYVYFLALAALYFWSLYRISTWTLDQIFAVPPADRERSGQWLLLILGLVHLLPVGVLQRLFTWGLADQLILGNYLQPATFGVLLLFGLALYLGGRPFLGALITALSCLWHPTYLLSVLVLATAFAVGEQRAKKSWAKPVLLLLLTILVIAPIALYAWQVFRPTSPAVAAAARDILVKQRIPHHADPAAWFSWYAVFQLLLIGYAAWLVRWTRLGVVIRIGLLAMVILSVLALAKGQLLLVPWRLSVWLVPLSSAVLAAACSSKLLAAGHARLLRPLQQHGRSLYLLLLLVLMAGGAYPLLRWQLKLVPGESFLKNARPLVARTATVLVPTTFENARLWARVPIYVDWKSHPYRDSEVLEWYSRFKKAERFYQQPSLRCRLLREIQQQDTHLSYVLLPAEGGLNCPGVTLLRQQDGWALYRSR